MRVFAPPPRPRSTPQSSLGADRGTLDEYIYIFNSLPSPGNVRQGQRQGLINKKKNRFTRERETCVAEKNNQPPRQLNPLIIKTKLFCFLIIIVEKDLDFESDDLLELTIFISPPPASLRGASRRKRSLC